MPYPKHIRRAILALALAWPGTQFHAQAAASEVAPDVGSVAGQLLVASPEIGDERFAGTVILMIRDDKEGALGIVINRPVEDHSIADLLESIGQPADGVEGSVPIFAGGPVERGIGFVLHSPEYRQDGTAVVTDRISLTSNATILRDIGNHRGPRKVLVAFGYAGWASGQLQREIALHAWATTAADPALVFDEDRDRVWDLAWARRSISL